MKRELVEGILSKNLKQIYGFALKRCANLQDAEDLSQDIMLKAFRTLIVRDDIENIEKFIWTVAHNALANYYRDTKSQIVSVSIEEYADILSDNSTDIMSSVIFRESIEKLQKEIAYLSKLQRQILVMYYYENISQKDISRILNIPLGTVKWHLFEAKKELKRGINMVRQNGELKFNPIKFTILGFVGGYGKKGPVSNFFRTAITQNIVYSTYQKEKSINEIADDLGVSPVYIESEVEFLYEYGFLIKKNGKYITNMLIDIPNENAKKIVKLQDDMYSKASKLIANDVYDFLLNSNVINSSEIVCEYEGNAEDKINYFMWTLVPYICALGGDNERDEKIRFEEVATRRPDGGNFFAHAGFETVNGPEQKYFDSIQNWNGPCFCYDDNYMLWACDSEWSNKRNVEGDIYTSGMYLTMLRRHLEGEKLSKDEYAQLAEKGFIKMSNGRAKLQIIYIKDSKFNKILLEKGKEIKNKHFITIKELKDNYINLYLKETPKHLRKMREYELQHIFYSDGWFLIYCIKELLSNGKLKLPTENEKKSVTTLIAPLTTK